MVPETKQCSLDDILITKELLSRPTRTPNLEAENEAFRTLARQLVEQPQMILKTLVTLAKDLCQAGSAGVSLLETTATGEEYFRWPAIVGALASYEGGTMLRDLSPCGVSIERQAPQLYAYPARYFTKLQPVEPAVVEEIIIPLMAANQPLGAIWIVSHDPQHQFDREDLRIMTSLADFTAAALHNTQARQAAESAQTLLQMLLEHVPEGITIVGGPPDFPLVANSKLAQEWLGRPKTPLIGPVAEPTEQVLKILCPDGLTPHAPEQLPLYRATRYGETIRDQEFIVERADGTQLKVNANVVPMRNAQGDIMGAINCWRDITEQKRIEATLERREADLSLVTNAVPVLISFIDLEQRYRFNNRTYEEWFGRPASAVYGKTMWEVLGDQAYATIRPFVEQVLAGQTVSFEREVAYREGGTRYIHATYVPRLDEQGLQGFVALVSDISERKQAEAALRQSEERLRIAQQAANAGVWNWDVVTDEVIWTGEHYRIYGLDETAVQPSYDNWLASIIEADRDRCDRAIHEALDQQTNLNIEFRIYHPIRQEERWIVAMGQTFYNAEQQPVRMTGIALDITDRKRTELEREELLARERNYVEQLQGLTTAALTINAALSVEEVLHVITDQAAAIIGAHQSVTSMTLDQNWAQAINAIYLSEKYAAWHDYHEKPTGAGIYSSVCRLNQPMRLTQAELEAHTNWQGFGSEATRHPPLRGWLAAPLVGRDGHNIGLIQLSDKEDGEFTAADEAMLVQLAQMASVAVENARLYEAERQARAAAEAAREAAQSANRIKDEFLAVLSHELRSPLNPILGWARLLQTSKLDEAKVNQALATIERNAKLQAELIEDLLDVSRILRGKLSLRMIPIDLVSTIQSAMETVRLGAEAKSIDLTLEVHRSLMPATPEMASSEAPSPESPVPDAQSPTAQSLEIQSPEAPIPLRIQGDSARIQQVIWNLLSNAIKFTPTQGQVKVCVKPVEREQVGQRAARSTGAAAGGLYPTGLVSSPPPACSLTTSYAQITVTDTGKGIAADFLPYVFEYFRQADNATTRKFGGLGLGLAIVQHLVELHGGTIQADSPGEGLGATFTVWLPLLNQHSRKPRRAIGRRTIAAEASHLPPLTGLHLLVVDDNSDARDYTVCLLEQAGARVSVAASAQEALEQFSQTKPDLLLSDIGMPDMDGCMLLRQVRRLSPEKGGTIPAIALTAYADENSQQMVRAAGFQRHIFKPLDPEPLIQAVKTLIADTHPDADPNTHADVD